MVYGLDPPSVRSYEPGDTRVPAVAKIMEEWDVFLADVRYRLEQVQKAQKRHYDAHHRVVVYNVGDWALLRLRHRAPALQQQPVTGKLKPRFYGHYLVTKVINEVAVRLALPPQARLHDVFHVGVLKKFIGTPPTGLPPLPPIHFGAVAPEPERAVRTRLACSVRRSSSSGKGSQRRQLLVKTSSRSSPSFCLFSSRTS